MTKTGRTWNIVSHRAIILLTISILILSMLVGCDSFQAELSTVNYAPLPADDWAVSTPAEQGLSPDLVAETYLNASQLETLYGLLVVKKGHLVADFIATSPGE